VLVMVAWNILMSILLLLQMGAQKFEVSDDDASISEVIATTVTLVIILLISDLYFRLSWAVTLSICIFYSTSVAMIITWAINYFDSQIPDVMK